MATHISHAKLSGSVRFLVFTDFSAIAVPTGVESLIAITLFEHINIPAKTGELFIFLNYF